MDIKNEKVEMILNELWTKLFGDAAKWPKDQLNIIAFTDAQKSINQLLQESIREERGAFLADLRSIPRGESFDGIVRRNVWEISKLIEKYSPQEDKQ